MTAADLPYAGVRVLDVSQGLAGPYCAGLLGMQGASVIKVEPPGGDWIRNAGGGREGMTSLAIMGSPGKRSACIDATKPEGKALLLRMARDAAVFVQNFRPWPLGPSPRVDEHTLEILAEAGVREAERAALIASGVVHQAPVEVKRK